jgi:hypothetical protein
MELLYYAISIIVLFALGIVWGQFVAPYVKDTKSIRLVLLVVDYIVKNFNFNFKTEASLVVKYCLEALSFVEEFNQDIILDEKRALVKDKAIEILGENGITVGNEEIQIVDAIVDYLVEIGLLK